MKKSFLPLLLILLLLACRPGNKVPDVSAYHATTVIQRFDKDFFALDTLHIDQALNDLNARYPDFLPEFLVKILGVNPGDPMAPAALGAFIRSYKPIFDTAQIVAEKALPLLEKDMQLGLKLMQYYFPGYKPDSPFVITSFVGPMDVYEPFPEGDYGDVRTRNGAGVALQLHLGANASVYEVGRQSGIFYDYQTRRFIPEMMSVNCMKNIIDDAFPYNAKQLTLVEDMIEKGKRLYVLEKLLPNTADSLQLGYTKAQLEGCYENEALIWNFFIKNDLLYSKEASINQQYIKDGPKTQELGEGAPGYIGLFVGRQLVRAFMQKNSDVSLTDLMKKPATAILNEGAYKP